MKNRKIMKILLIGCFFLIIILSCGPIEYSAVILDANEVIAEAEENNAKQLAPYEYWYAHEHLRKARMDVGYAEYQMAADNARLAREYGTKARDIAIKRHREQGR